LDFPVPMPIRLPFLPSSPGPSAPQQHWWWDVVTAFRSQIRIFAPLNGQIVDPAEVSRSMAWFPLAGAVLGIFAAAVDGVGSLVGLDGTLSGLFALLFLAIATGGMHDESFLRFVQALAEGRGSEHRRAILHGSALTVAGILALLFALLFKVFALGGIELNKAAFGALIAAPCWSRACMVAVAGWLQATPYTPDRPHPDGATVMTALAVGGFVCFLILPMPHYAFVLSAGVLVAIAVAALARAFFGGLTNAALGALQQSVEIAAFVTLVAVQ
jgi:adenosylcobinamide-GDP ribazoletransferase